MSMSTTLEGSRRSSGRRRRKSAKVDRLLVATGVKSNDLSEEKLPKAQADGQFKEFGGRCTTALEAITADLKVLELIPGTAKAIVEWKKKQEAAIAPQARGEWNASLILLGELQNSLHEEVISQQKALTKTLTDSGRQRKDYETLCGELTALSDQLAQYPATAPSLREIETAFSEAKASYDEDEFAAAVKTLQDAKQNAKTMLGTLDKFDKAARGSTRLKPVYERLNAFDSRISEAEGLLGKAAVAGYRTQSSELRDLVLKAADDSKSKKEMNQAKDLAVQRVGSQLDRAESELDRKVNGAAEIRREVTGQLEVLQRDIAISGELQPASEVESAYKELARIRGALGGFDYTVAKDICDKLGQTIQEWSANAPTTREGVARKALETFKQPAEEQLRIAKDLEGRIPTAPILLTPPTVASVIEMLTTQLDRYKAAPNTFPLSQGLETVKIATGINATNKNRADDYEKLAIKREELSGKIKRLEEQVRTSIAAMIKEIAKSGTVIQALPSYETQLKTILSDWTDASTSAQNEKQLRFDEFAKRLEALQKQVHEDLTDPVKVTDKAVEGRFADLAAAFKEAANTADRAIEALIDVDYDAGDTQRGYADAAAADFDKALKARDPDAAAKAIEETKKITSDASTAAERARQNLARNMLAFDVTVRDVREAIGRLIRSTSDNSKLKDYAGIAAAFQSECNQLAATGTSTDSSIIEASLEQLYALRGKVNDLAKLFETIKSGKKPEVTLDKLRDQAAKAAKTYGKPAIKFEAARLKDLMDKLTSVTQAIGTVSLAESSQALADLDIEWDELKAAETQHKTDVQTFAAAIKTLKKDYFEQKGDLQKFWDEQVPDYKKALIAKLDGLSSAATSDGTLDQTALNDIKTEIITAVRQPDIGERHNAQAQTAALEEKLAEKAWVAAYTSFKGTVKGLRAILETLDEPAAGNFKKQIEELESSASVVKKSEGKTPYTTMIDQIKALAANAERMHRFPMGQATAARGEIMPANKAWNDAVEQFHRTISSLPVAIRNALTGDPNTSEVMKAIQDKVTRAQDLIPLGSVTALAQKVVDAKDDISAARDAREEAMREVKRLQRLVLGAPQFMALAGNPFKVDVTSELGNLNAALFSFETVLAISL